MQKPIEFLLKRRSTLAIMLESPGPTDAELEQILTAGSRVPDHGKLVPWRFLLFSGEARADIGAIIAKEFALQNPKANDEQIESEGQLFLRAPLVVGVISTAAAHVKVPQWEQQLTAGAVCQNLLHAAAAFGYAGQWLTQWVAYNEKITDAMGVKTGEKMAGLIYIGTSSNTPADRARPNIAEITEKWTIG